MRKGLCDLKLFRYAKKKGSRAICRIREAVKSWLEMKGTDIWVTK